MYAQWLFNCKFDPGPKRNMDNPHPLPTVGVYWFICLLVGMFPLLYPTFNFELVELHLTTNQTYSLAYSLACD